MTDADQFREPQARKVGSESAVIGHNSKETDDGIGRLLTLTPFFRKSGTSVRALAKGWLMGDPFTPMLGEEGVEEALEGKTRDILGRDYYEHGAQGRDYRNGYRPGRLKTTEGEVQYAVPQLRDADNSGLAAFCQALSGRSEALVDLALETYARGCSTRDIEVT